MTRPAPWTPSGGLTLLLVGILCLIWGSTWLVIKEGLKDLPPLTSASVRFGVAAAVMFMVAPFLSAREGGESPPTWLWLSSGLLNFTATYGLVYVAETVLPSGLVSVLWAVYPLLMAVAGHVFLPGERLEGRQWVGFAIGFLGIVYLFNTDVRNVGGSAVGVGTLLLLSPLCSVVGTVIVKGYGSHVSSVLLNRNGMLVCASVLGGLAVLFESDAKVVWSPTAIASVLYLAGVGTVVTFSLYFWLLRYAQANRLALIAFMTPCVAVVLGWALGGERITASMIAGAGLVVVGVALVVLSTPSSNGLRTSPQAS